MSTWSMEHVEIIERVVRQLDAVFIHNLVAIEEDEGDMPEGDQRFFAFIDTLTDTLTVLLLRAAPVALRDKTFISAVKKAVTKSITKAARIGTPRPIKKPKPRAWIRELLDEAVARADEP